MKDACCVRALSLWYYLIAAGTDEDEGLILLKAHGMPYLFQHFHQLIRVCDFR